MCESTWPSSGLPTGEKRTDEALAFYGRLFDFTLRGRSDTAAFIDLGDQFLALQKGRTQGPDDGRHFGLGSLLDRGFQSSSLQNL